MTPTVTSSTSGNPAAAAPSATQAAKTGFGENFESFLKLLTTQLRNQDPMSPLDTNQFTQQLVSFSQVEQAIKGNEKLASLVSILAATQVVDTLPLVGRQVEVASASNGLQNGKATFAYTLPAAAKQTALTITDEAGGIVFRAVGETGAGAHEFAWDGKTSKGKPVPDGIYKLEVGAARLDDTPMAVPVTSIGTVDGVTQKNGAANLTIGKLEIPTTKLVGVRN